MPLDQTEFLSIDNPAELADLTDQEKTFIITDDRVDKLYSDHLTCKKKIVIPHGEKSKNQKTIDKIIQKLLNAEADRDCYLLGVGGGVVTDITGYVASIYKRGVAFGFVPTTLLAQADASIGGKNGINFDGIKNLIGTIRQPSKIILCTEFLETLPRKHFRSGMAEIIKTAIVDNAELYDYLETNEVNEDHENYLRRATGMTIESKIRIVKQDVQDRGIRRILNFGHTFGHAIESSDKMPHGYAVSLGMVKALQISLDKMYISTETYFAIIRLLEKYGLPTQLILNPQKVLKGLYADKKKNSDNINVVLIKGIAQPVIEPIAIKELIRYI